MNDVREHRPSVSTKKHEVPGGLVSAAILLDCHVPTGGTVPKLSPASNRNQSRNGKDQRK